MPRRDLHNIEIEDSDANWLNWGTLVLDWIDNVGNRPQNVGSLKLAIERAGILPSDYRVRGLDNRPVRVNTYPGVGPIIIPVPTRRMIDDDRAFLQRVFERPASETGYPQAQYPIPGFYDRMYSGAPARRVFATYPEMEAMGLRRLGEYVINECM